MQSDDLNRPLTGRTPPPGEAALGAGAPWGKLAVGGLGLLGALLAGFVWMTDDGAGGQPFAVARIEPLRTPVAATAAPAAAPATVARENGVTTVRPSGEGREENGVRVVRRGGSGADPIIINVQDALDLSLAPAPDQRLVERTRHGLAPRNGADGARPMEVYARPQMTSGAVRANAPRIALVVGGMGLNPELTRAAVESLPPAVTLGFAPYGPDLAAQAAHAREQGHEILLQAPMEGFGGAAEDPGPNVLRASDPANVTLDKLMWHMTRFPGYVGVAGFLGGKFTADSRAFAPVLS
ncbi:MAG TPA: divergent polysaccharide deacetylase family protein, partial [Beijerinckiaceae bacterium]